MNHVMIVLMRCISVISYLNKLQARLSSLRDGPLEKLWGGGGEFSSCKNFFSLSNSLHEFYLGHCMNIF